MTTTEADLPEVGSSPMSFEMRPFHDACQGQDASLSSIKAFVDAKKLVCKPNEKIIVVRRSELPIWPSPGRVVWEGSEATLFAVVDPNKSLALVRELVNLRLACDETTASEMLSLIIDKGVSKIEPLSRLAAFDGHRVLGSFIELAKRVREAKGRTKSSAQSIADVTLSDPEVSRAQLLPLPSRRFYLIVHEIGPEAAQRLRRPHHTVSTRAGRTPTSLDGGGSSDPTKKVWRGRTDFEVEVEFAKMSWSRCDGGKDSTPGLRNGLFSRHAQSMHDRMIDPWRGHHDRDNQAAEKTAPCPAAAVPACRLDDCEGEPTLRRTLTNAPLLGDGVNELDRWLKRTLLPDMMGWKDDKEYLRRDCEGIGVSTIWSARSTELGVRSRPESALVGRAGWIMVVNVGESDAIVEVDLGDRAAKIILRDQDYLFMGGSVPHRLHCGVSANLLRVLIVPTDYHLFWAAPLSKKGSHPHLQEPECSADEWKLDELCGKEGCVVCHNKSLPSL